MVFERTVNSEEPECSQESLSVVDEALSSLTDSVSSCTGALVCCGASQKVISWGEDFVGVLPIFHTKWPEHIFHSCHLQIGCLLLDKGEKGGGKMGSCLLPLTVPQCSELGPGFIFP